MNLEGFIRIFLPIYFIIYFGFTFVIKSILIAKKIRKSPFVFPDKNSVYGLVGYYMKLIVVLLIFYIFIFVIFPEWYKFFLPILQIDKESIKYFGILLLILSFIWTFYAQKIMRISWRIGIDTQNKTELISIGLFRKSRNPVFLGMIGSLLGLFLITPNSVTLIIFILGYVLIQIQVRLEEGFLMKVHGDKYLDYCKKVRRWI